LYVDIHAMPKENKRREFIKNALLAATGVGIIGKSISAIASESTTENTNPILKVKPLGFQWDTQDPFLFCVHHEDASP